MSGVTFIDSVGLGSFVTPKCEHPEARLIAGPAVDRILDVTGLKSHFGLESQPRSLGWRMTDPLMKGAPMPDHDPLDRERRLTTTFVTLADTMVGEFDVAELMYLLVDQCKATLDVDEAGLLLADAEGDLAVMGATAESIDLIELLQIQGEEGPCLDAYRTGKVVYSGDFASGEAQERWPRFSPAVLSVGYTSITALPMRLRERSIGSLNLFHVGRNGLSSRDQGVAQAMADVATIGLLQERALRNSELLVDQLQGALDSRVVIEQAKGIVAERLDLDMGQAFELLRGYSRDTNDRLAEVCRRLIEGALPATDLKSSSRAS